MLALYALSPASKGMIAPALWLAIGGAKKAMRFATTLDRTSQAGLCWHHQRRSLIRRLWVGSRQSRGEQRSLYRRRSALDGTTRSEVPAINPQMLSPGVL
jgi:hypothetical protein